MLSTAAERFLKLEARITMLELELRRLRHYAESSDRLHHEAIIRLSQQAGNRGWPPQPHP